MNIKKVNALIPASFTYKYQDAEGNEQTEAINLQLRRLSFSLVNDQLQKLFADGSQNSAAFAAIFVQIIASWNIFLDDAEKEMMPVTEEFFLGPDCPADFMTELTSCIFEKLTGNPQKAASSPNGSEPAAPSSQESAETSTSVTDSPPLAASGV